VSDPAVFLTGFPGFLGSALLERICVRTDDPVACLVQSKYLEMARQRAQDIAKRTGDDGVETKIQLYEGDITEPDLGLGERRERLQDVREMYHLAAVYDLGVDRELATAVNVDGTEHVLDAAQSLGVEEFHYVSTCYVSGRYDGVFTEDHLQEGQEFNNHYEETKFQAEVAVQERMAEGFPATIYRPAIVVGDSQTGETDKFDGPYNLLRLLFAQPRACSAAFTLPGSGVEAIAHLSAREQSTGEVYQLCDPSPLSVLAFEKTLADAAGHRTVRVPTTKPIARAATTLLERLGVHVDPHTLDYLDHPTRYACPKTRQALAGSGIAVPPFESYVDRLVAFAREHPDIGDQGLV